jgi:hypothetical protein
MKLPRRNFLHLAAGAATLPALSRIAWAQAYPTRPVRLIVPFPAGACSIFNVRASVRQVRARDHLGDIDQPLFWCKWRRDGYRPCASRRATRIAHRRRA